MRARISSSRWATTASGFRVRSRQVGRIDEVAGGEATQVALGVAVLVALLAVPPDRVELDDHLRRVGTGSRPGRSSPRRRTRRPATPAPGALPPRNTGSRRGPPARSRSAASSRDVEDRSEPGRARSTASTELGHHDVQSLRRCTVGPARPRSRRGPRRLGPIVAARSNTARAGVVTGMPVSHGHVVREDEAGPVDPRPVGAGCSRRRGGAGGSDRTGGKPGHLAAGRGRCRAPPRCPLRTPPMALRATRDRGSVDRGSADPVAARRPRRTEGRRRRPAACTLVAR